MVKSPWAEILVIPGAETDEDLVAPRPDAVIGRPAAESALLVIDRHVLDGSLGGPVRIGGDDLKRDARGLRIPAVAGRVRPEGQGGDEHE